MDADVEVGGSAQVVATPAGHVIAAGLGIVFAVAVEGLTLLERDLRAASMRDVVAWPLWALAGLFVVFGAVMVVIVLRSRRMPWLPTAAAALLLYGMVASLPGNASNALPFMGRWVPSANWGQSTVALIAGVMVATAVWSWWLHLRSDHRRGAATSRGRTLS